MYLGYRIYKHNISYIIMHHYSLTAKQIEQGESPEIAEPHRCQQVYVEYPTDNSTQKIIASVCSDVAYS